MSLDIVIGPMFSGKSSYALAQIRRRQAVGLRVVIIKPAMDVRYGDAAEMVTHDGDKIPCITWDTRTPLLVTSEMMFADYIVIEEAQFFTSLRSAVKQLVKQLNKNVLIVGLDGDFKQEPIGEILLCIPWASNVTKLNAMCYRCGIANAPFTKKKVVVGGPQIEVGGADKYSAVCLAHL
jgi:thymidine kinase